MGIRRYAIRYWIDALCLAAFAGVALWSWWPADLLSNTTLIGGGVGDPAGQVSALAWTPFAIVHHLNPFITNWSNYPVGLNVAANAVAPLVGLLAWPITATVGPVAAVNVVFPLAFFSSATSMYFVTRRFGISRFPSLVGGFVFGFSPYMIGQSLGHLAILWTFLIPVMGLYLFRLLTNTSINPRRDGLILGIVCALQVYIADELLISVAVVTCLTAVVCLVVRPRKSWERLFHSVIPLAYSLLTFILFSGVMLYYQLFGPHHISGPPQPTETLDSYTSDLISPLVPTSLEREAPWHLSSIGDHLAVGNIGENGAYLGLPLLLLVLIVAIVRRKDRLVAVSCVFALIAFVVSIGPHLVIDSRITSIPMPFLALMHLPLISSQVPSRYSLLMQLGVAVVCAVALERGFFVRDHYPKHSRKGWANRAAVVFVAALVLFPRIPAFPVGGGPTPYGVPSGVTSLDLSKVPFGSVLLAYPYPGPEIEDEAVLWQALFSYRFKIIGGYAIYRSPANGAGTPFPAILEPTGVQAWFYTATYGQPEPDGDAPVIGYPRTVTRAATLIDRFVLRYDVATVIVEPVGEKPMMVVAALDRALGTVKQAGGVYIWYDVERRARSRSAA